MTAHAMAGDRERCLQEGMDDYVAKPIEAHALFDVIARVVRGAAEEPVRERSTARAPLDRASVLARLDGDANLLKEVTDLLADEAPALLDRLRAAAAAGDSSGIERAAHALKSCVGQFEAETAATADWIEQCGRRGDLSEIGAGLALLEQQVADLVAEMRAIAQEAVA